MINSTRFFSFHCARFFFQSLHRQTLKEKTKTELVDALPFLALCCAVKIVVSEAGSEGAGMPRYGITDIENFAEKIRFSLLLLSPRALVEKYLTARPNLYRRS